MIAQTPQPRPGTTILIGIVMDPKPGWHSYWSNPGDAGIAPSAKWTAPAGVTFGPLHHPAPTLARVGEDTSFVHGGRHILLVPMTLSGKMRRGTALPVTAQLVWGSCTDRACVPERATLSLRLVAGSGLPGPDIARLAAAKAKLPKPARPSTYMLGKSTITLRVPSALGLKAARTHFFPDSSDFFDAGTAIARTSDRRILITAPFRSKPPYQISGVISDGQKAYRLVFRRD